MTEIAASLAHQIARMIREEALPPGTALTERALADRFLVSRTPVRAALQELRRAGVLGDGPRGGLVVADPGRAELLAETAPPEEAGEAAYLAIARDRLAGLIPDRISENELLRRYDLSRPRLQALLHRMAEEGWAERRPGHGWQFLPVLTSMEAYRQSYRFRQAIEPAAMRDPGFRLNVPLLTRHLEEQRRLVAGEVLTITGVHLFTINAAMHEAICECSGNGFFIESLRRVDRLRRLIEYGLTVDRTRARARCAEHVQMLELLLAGRNDAAADLMHRHLAALGPIKAATMAAGREGSAEAPDPAGVA